MIFYSGYLATSSLVLLLSSLSSSSITTLSSVDAFSSSSSLPSSKSASSFIYQPHQSSTIGRRRRRQTKRTTTTLHVVGAELDPDDVLPALATTSTSITPEGFGFSSPAGRVLTEANRNGGFYKAKASDLVTDVMEGITNGKMDAALVFDDTDNAKLLGIFTETDYIKVR